MKAACSIILFFSIIKAISAQYTLTINEIGAISTGSIADFNGEFSDWIEIYNYGEEPVCLQNCFLSDDPFNPFIFQLSPAPELCIQPYNYLLLFANQSAQTHPQHLPFELDAEGEYLGLFNPDGQLIFEVYFGTQYPEISYGIESGSSNWNFFNAPSPGSANPTSGLYAPLPSPVSNGSSGYYNESFVNLTLEHPFNWTELRYTTDGTTPGPFSSLYISEITLTVPGVLRARAFADGYLPGNELVLHFIPAPAGSISTVSVVINPEDFEGQNGINTFIYSGLEKPSHIACLNSEAGLILNQGAGIRIHAPEYRDQQAFRISARSEYGNPVFNGSLFPNALYSDFQHLIFRCGGNDGIELSGSSLRDPLNHSLFHQINPAYATSNYEPVEIYINGEFWGLYEMMERQDQHYINARYFENDCDILERSADAIETNTYNAITGSFNDFNALESFVAEEDLSIESNYNFVQTWMDIPNFVDYQLLEIYSCNKDWLSNNLKMWRPLDHSRPWQWILWDTDWSYGTMFPADHAYPNWNALDHALSDWAGWTDEVETELLQNLVLNQEFKDYFCTRAADLSNSYLKPEVIIETLDSLKSRIEPDIPRQCDRWGSSYNDWLDEYEDIVEFISSRNTYFLEHLRNRFELGELYPLNLQISPPGAGYIEINTIETNQEFWTGDYFENLGVHLKAVAAPGYTFQNWAEYGENAEIEVEMFGTQNRIAHFIPITEYPSPVINEISLHNENLTGVWIEIYNPGNIAIPLGSLMLGDGNGQIMQLPENTFIEPNSFFMLAQSPSSLIDDSDVAPEDIALLDFGLNPEQGTLYLMNENQALLDVVNYLVDSSWPQCEESLVYTLELTDPALNNDAGTSWFCDERPYGSPGKPNIEVNLGIAQIEEQTWYLFPNPVSEKLFVKTEIPASRISVCLTDIMGNVVHCEEITAYSGTAVLNIPGKITSGLYTCRLSYEGVSVSQKVIVQR